MLSLLLSPVCLAAIYKCEINGVMTFSENPCGENSQEIDLTPPPTIKHNSQTSYDNTIKSRVGYVRQREINRDIEILKKRIAHLNKLKREDLQLIESESELAKAQRKTAHQIAQARNQAIRLINQKYKDEIYQLKIKIRNLQKQKSNRTKQSTQSSSKSIKTTNKHITLDRNQQLQNYKQQIKQAEKQLDSLKRQLKHKISSVKKKQTSSRLSSTEKMQLRVELDLLKQRYKNLIAQQQAKIRALQVEKLKLN